MLTLGTRRTLHLAVQHKIAGSYAYIGFEEIEEVESMCDFNFLYLYSSNIPAI